MQEFWLAEAVDMQIWIFYLATIQPKFRSVAPCFTHNTVQSSNGTVIFTLTILKTGVFELTSLR